MFLNELVIASPYLGEIRRVKFHKGVNLILDKSTVDHTGTGNSVGKTTVLRSLDFCFGAKQEIFYTDPEFRNDNDLIKDFLITNEVSFTLSIEIGNNKYISISRVVLPAPKVFCKISDTEYTNLNKFCHDLKTALFFSQATKPSLRQIMSRFIRDTPDKMSNTLKTLFNKTSNSEYETLNLFLFGFEDASILSEKQIQTKSLKKFNSELSVLTKIKSKNSLAQALEIINRDIAEKESEIINYNLGESYEVQMTELNRIKSEVAKISLDVSSLKMKRTLNNEAINDLLEQQDNSKPDDLKNLYAEATDRVGQLNKTFEDALNFHNQMIIKKVEFIKSQMGDLNSQISTYDLKLKSWLEKESLILKELSNSGSLSDLQLIQKEINKLYESKGSFESSLSQIESHEEKIKKLTTKLNIISEKIMLSLERFNNRLVIFNKFFSLYTKVLYEEEFILSYDNKNDSYQFTIDSIGMVMSKGNLGDGKKKAQVSAFDLAYLSLQEATNSRTIRFVAHDGIEAIHPNQIRILFDIASTIDGQYILAILSDKLSTIDSKFIKNNTILELSEDDKFFKC